MMYKAMLSRIAFLKKGGSNEKQKESPVVGSSDICTSADGIVLYFLYITVGGRRLLFASGLGRNQ